MTRAPERIDLASVLRRAVEAAPGRRFLTFTENGASWTYEEFDGLVNRAAHGLRALGVQRGDLVNVMLPNCPEYLAISYALKKLGAVEVAINAQFRGTALARMLNVSAAALLVTAPDFEVSIGALAGDLSHIETVVLVGGGECPVPGARSVPLAELLDGAAQDPGVSVSDRELATVIFTSGTTGVSKGCMRPHRSLVRTAESIRDALDLTGADCVYTPFPLFHTRAAYADILGALLVGAEVVLAPRFSASRFWAHMQQFDVTVFSIIGTMMQILWKRPSIPDERGHRVRITWGGPITVPPPEFEARFGVPVLPGDGIFGMTETGMVNMTSFDPEASGKVRPIYEVQIADEHDDPLPPGEVGEILVRPREAGVMSDGYLAMPEATVESWRNLWFHTGDLGRMDAEGRLMFVGRKREMIRRGGHNISAWEVEEVVDAHPAVLESAALPVPSPLGEDELKVFVVVQPGEVLDAEALISHCRERLAAFMVPQHVEFIDVLPKTPTGKPAKARLAELDAR